MKLSRKWLIVAALVLSVAMATTGTMAYLQDTDSDVNVMTMGSVHIEQHEFERVVGADGQYTTIDVDGTTSYELKDFTQGKPLLPFVGEVNNGYDPTEVRLGQLGHNSRGGMQVFPAKNVVDKFVVVENTGRSDAFVRTIVAFEAGAFETVAALKDVINYSFHFTWHENVIDELVEIDGNNYLIVEFTYKGYEDVQHPNGVLTPGDYTYNSLAQVYMYNTATNEDMIALDGNGNELFDILVLSQAVQADGFADAKTALDTAFGEVNEENVPNWFSDLTRVYVDNASELNDALNNASKVIFFEGDIESNLDVIKKNATINLDGHKLDNTKSENPALEIGEGVNLKISNGDLVSGSTSDYGFIGHKDSVATFQDVNLDSKGGGIGAVDGAKVIFNGGSVAVNSANTSGRYNFYAEGDGTVIIINGGEFSFSKTLNQKRAYIYAGSGTTVYVNGGTFGPASTRDGYTAGIMGNGTVVITGGTFGFNPSNWVADGYEAVQNGSNWIVTAK